MDITKSSGYRDFMWAVNLHRLGFEMVGLWPKSNKCTKKSLWPEIWVGIVLILLIFISNVPMICAVIEVWGNMILVIDNLHTTLPQLMISMKYVIIRRKQTVLLSIVNMMAEDWMAFKLDGERDVMIKRAQTARLIMMVGYVLMVIMVVTIITLPCFGIQVLYVTNITSVRKPLPLKAYHFYNTDKSPQFELTFFIHSLTALLGGTIYMCVDFFLVLTVLHICGQLENLRCRLINLISCKNFNKVLNNIVATHLRLIRYEFLLFADNIENTYSLMMLCNAVYRVMCDLKWYKLESRKARSLILLIMRAKHPFRFTAGKIFPLTMVTFCSTIKDKNEDHGTNALDVRCQGHDLECP
ncbi:uncharacterized protein [Mycetomoellerius zeteki]|uniref:uncharacterized protein n=1 Tax=Mycetomoellerius zeteki TaxID=64791 RepID=UPI00084EBA5F|nr:PREDICTED: uncharacterized protein LOC108722895 [Trachymyrmex zeteki]